MKYFSAFTNEPTVALQELQGFTLLVQRSPVAKGRLRSYVRDLTAWVESAAFKDVLTLASADSAHRSATQLVGDQFRYLSTGQNDGRDPKCSAIGWTRMEELEPWQTAGGGGAGSADEEADAMAVASPGPLEGGAWGRARSYWRAPFWEYFLQFKARKQAAIVIICFCSEGDNVPEAMAMADRVDQLLGLLAVTDTAAASLQPSSATAGRGREGPHAPVWRIPQSWAHVFGPPPDVTIFG
eukprot:TRINITY_DN7986_c0_g1_i2.p1 TRINITY_DN7986_c0_g1~~TRINITY_DN7986_c0_g1_i2.p1  ORF type:complete len:240 (-),score=64.94 TRINITY_DN7986_c0_g1_i2:227-946(-)